MVRNFTDQELLERVAQLPSFKGFQKGFMDLWIRSKADQFNVFDDKAYLFDCRGDKPKFLMVRQGTTNAGSYGLLHFAEYNHDGCAVLKSDEIVPQSHRYGLHHGKPAFVQAKAFPFYRDANKNQRAEEIGPVHTDEIIGANDHRAGVHSTVINNWSTACLVTAIEAEYEKFLAATDRHVLTVCILKEW